MLVGGYAAVPQGVRQGRVRQDAQPRGVGGVKQEINVPAHKNVAPKQVLLLFQQGAVALWRESRLRSAEWSQHVGGEKQPRVLLDILAREQRNHPHGLGGALQAQLQILLPGVSHVEGRAVVAAVLIQRESAPGAGGVANEPPQSVLVQTQAVGQLLIKGVWQAAGVQALLVAQVQHPLPQFALPRGKPNVPLVAVGLLVDVLVQGVTVNRVKIRQELLAGGRVKLRHGGAHGLGEGQGVQLAAQLAAAGVAGVQHGLLVLGQGAGVCILKAVLDFL